MKIRVSTWPIILLIFHISMVVHTCFHTHFAACQCQDDQKSLLLQLHNTLQIDPSASSLSTKLNSWNNNQSKDCCQWGGVTCDPSTGQVIELDLSNEGLRGTLLNSSALFRLQFLQTLNLGYNNLSGSIMTLDWGSFLSMKYLDLSVNSLTGNIPTSLFSLPSLHSLYLFDNNLEGSIPNSIFLLKGLESLDLSQNKFHGTIDLTRILQSFINLSQLDLSHNNLSVIANGKNANHSSSLPQLSELGLASCNLFAFPESLKYQSSLEFLDLSNNHISGKVPTWIWKGNEGIGVLEISHLNLSHNDLIGFEHPLPQSSLFRSVDLHSNNFQGQVPIIPMFDPNYLDCSKNNFTSINPKFGDSLSSLWVLYLSRNNIQGNIPSSICKLTSLGVLDLEYNRLNGTIPECLLAMKGILSVLNLGGNNLHGVIQDNFQKPCTLQSFVVNMNYLHGKIPQSLANCQWLNVLDLGNNRLDDTFPCHLQNLPRLQVLGLRSNKLHGNVVCSNGQHNSSWSSLQIMDLASNHFNGQLSTLFVGNWGTMMAKTNETPTVLGHPEDLGARQGFYPYEVHVTYKGLDYVLVKALTIFNVIDLSNNSFHGEIPSEMGKLNALIAFNLSHNFMSGNIPSSIGNLRNLESLDISYNNLSGNIPQQLASLNFLAYLNLSYNKLSGRIPTGTQLQSFTKSSFEGNLGLYGPPLTPIHSGRYDPNVVLPSPSNGWGWSRKSNLEWMLQGAEVGFPVGITIVIGPLLYIKRWRQWYFHHVDRLIKRARN